MMTRFRSHALGVSALLVFLAAPSVVEATYTSAVTGATATMTGDAAGDTLTITQSGGLFRHNRFTAGDAGFNSDFDFDSTVPGDQTVASGSGILNINAGDGNDSIVFGDGVVVRGTVDGGPGIDTIDYSAYTTAISANLGLGTTGLAATLGAEQENPPTTITATATAAVTNYNIVTHTFDINVVVTGLLPAAVTGFHIHQAAVGVNGPIIVDFTGVAPLVPAGTGFTFTANGLVLPAVNEAAFLGGGTYVNIHTAAFPGGAMRGQLFSGGNVALASGLATGTASVANVENVTGGAGNDSLVGNNLVNTITGGAGADWIVGGPGNDTLNGGIGADVLVWSNGDGTDIDEGGADADTVQVNGSTAAADIFTIGAGAGGRLAFARTNLGLFALDIGTVETLIVNGIGGADSFTVNDLTGVVTLSALNLNGFDGDDTFTLVPTSSGAVAFNVHGGLGTDTLQGPNGAEVWNVTAANLGNVTGLVSSFRFIEALVGGTGIDTFNVKAFATGTPTVTGGAGADSLSYNAEGRTVSGDATPPDGSIDSPGVQSVVFAQIEAVNTSPTISAIANQSTLVNTPTSAIPFTVADFDAGATLTVSGTSSNTTLVPNANIVFGGSGTNRTVTLTPAAGQTGTTTITVTVSDGSLTTPTTFVLTVNPLPTVSVDKTALRFSAVTSGASFISQTAPQTVRITQTGPGPVTWTAASTTPWLLVSPTSGSGSATLTISTQFVPGLTSSQTGNITLTFTGVSNTAGPIVVTLTTIPNGTSAAPFGVMDTPTEGSTGVTGSIPVTGWALDDVEVRQVRILRDPVAGEGTASIFIGNAVLVDGSRTDVAALYPTLPLNTRAGWGYLLLTNFLPNQGNGTFRLVAIADDADGHSTVLGSKTITCTNSTATRPFGAIDTPAQGEVISGTNYANFGWVLVRGPALAYPPNGTVSVVIDGVFGPAPTGWTSRADLTALFPVATYPGVNNALGVAALNPSTLTNGVHTIAWVVTADNGQADGVGSRYFSVVNGSVVGSEFTAPDATLQGSPGALRDEINAAPLDTAMISARRGYDVETAFEAVGGADSDRATVQGEELDRFEVRLSVGAGETYSGYTRVGDDLAPLPIGSHLDPETGEFAWQPGVGFVHDYDLVFVRWANGRAVARQEVRFVLNPKGSNRLGSQVVIDTPISQATVAQPFVVAGWASDLNDLAGTGVDTLHVWAYPVGGGDPIFAGVAAYGGERPDVAALFGARFRRSGYGLTVQDLPPGTYDLAVFAWSTVENRFLPAKVVRVTVR